VDHTKFSSLPKGFFRFTALDVETSCTDIDSVCQIGVACVEASNNIRTYSTFVNPQKRFDPFNTQPHGNGPDTVADAPTFPEVWQQMAPLLEQNHLVQHSNFDKTAIAACCKSPR